MAKRTQEHELVSGTGGVGWRISSTVPRPKRDSPSEAVKMRVFARDDFTCRYAHCQRRTIHLRILRGLSRAFPDLMPYHPRWAPLEQHILYWIYGTSLEHHVAFAQGGASTDENLITACYACNDLKGHLPAAVLGWVAGPQRPCSWTGLTEFLAPMRSQGYIP